MDTALIVALITALAAIITPIITAFISSKHSEKLKKLDLIYNAKLDAYTSFAKALTLSKAFNTEEYNEINKLINNVFVVANQKVRSALIIFIPIVDNHVLSKEDADIQLNFLMNVNGSEALMRVLDAMSEDLNSYTK